VNESFARERGVQYELLRDVDGAFTDAVGIATQPVTLFVAADGTKLPFAAGSFDAVTVAFGLRNMESWPAALREMSRVLRPGGHLLLLDFSMPRPPFAALYRFYLHRVLPVFAGFITGQRAGYEYLGESIEAFPSGEAMCRLMTENNFHSTQALPLAAGIVTIYTAQKP
jgi:demethylmenaquinone methyltransferase/2-methoxy-6-polyprenyl-1,4-benzoquinol methylase